MAGNRLLKVIMEASKPSQGQVTDLLYGKVTSTNPLKVSVDNRFELPSSFLILTSLVTNHTVNMTVDGETKPYEVNLGLEVGEAVILLRVHNGQKFIIIDRVR